MEIFMSNCTLFELGKASAETKVKGPGGADSPLNPHGEMLG